MKQKLHTLTTQLTITHKFLHHYRKHLPPRKTFLIIIGFMSSSFWKRKFLLETSSTVMTEVWQVSFSLATTVILPGVGKVRTWTPRHMFISHLKSNNMVYFCILCLLFILCDRRYMSENWTFLLIQNIIMSSAFFYCNTIDWWFTPRLLTHSYKKCTE